MSKYFFRDTIYFQPLTNTVGSGGEKVKSYTTTSTGGMVTLKGSFQNSGENWNVSNNVIAFRHNVRLFTQYSSSITEAYRVEYDNKNYEITRIWNTFNGHHLEFDLQQRSTSV